MNAQPEIQLIANLVVHDGNGNVLLAQYSPTREIDASDADTRWWLPASELDPYQHPDDAAQAALEDLGGLTVESLTMSRVQSFRGRRGWHLSFDYLVQAQGEPTGDTPAQWFDRNALPRTMHGAWERETIEHALS